MIFILKDLFDAKFDTQLASHIIDVHKAGGAAVEREISEDEIEVRSVMARLGSSQ